MLEYCALEFYYKLKLRTCGHPMSSNKYQIAVILWATCHATVTALCFVNATETNLPSTFPCQWLDGKIPYVFDFFAINSNRLVGMIREGHRHIEKWKSSCLTFQEYNPIDIARYPNDFFYLYYTYSGVLEDCCANVVERHVGRRVVLITVSCKEPVEIAHVTLHMLGLTHGKYDSFSPRLVDAVVQPKNCKKSHNSSNMAQIHRLNLDISSYE